MNENKKKKSSPEGDKIKLVAAVVCGIFVLMDAVGGSGTAFFMILICALVVVLAVIGIKKSQTGKNAQQTDAAQPQREFTRPAADRPRESSLSKRLTELMRDNTDDCDDDHEHIEPDIAADPNEKRAAQLREMLKNGIIEKDEYNILMRKFGLK